MTELDPRWSVDPVAVAAGLVEPEHHAIVEELRRVDPAFRAEIERSHKLLVALGSLPGPAWDPVPPPRLDVERVLGARTGASRRLRPRPLVVALGVAAALAFVVAGVAITRSRSSGTERTSRVELAPLTGSAPDLRAAVTLPPDAGGEVRLQISGAAPTPPGYIEELWFMDDGTHLVSVGTFRVAADGSADVTFATAADAHQYHYVDVSLEPEDGNPAHSGDSVLRSSELG
ncbi:MAG: anti-sigma factor [Ilumatobacteraceae bacterium]